MTQQPPFEHVEWLCSTRLMDLDDPALRLRVQSLTQLKATRRAKVLAVYAYVKRLPLRTRMKRRHSTATEVLRTGSGDAADKATLFVAMLRLLGVPARMRFVRLQAPMFHGFGVAMWRQERPIVEAWTGERWAGTDTYIFDPNCMAAARQRLKDKGLDCGHGLHVHGATTWDGLTNAYVSGCAPEQDPMVAEVLGLHHDPAGFLATRAGSGHARWGSRLLQWSMEAGRLGRTLRPVRAGLDNPGGAPHASFPQDGAS